MSQLNNINRRSFLGRAALGLGAVVGAPTLLSQIPQRACAAVSGDLLFCNSGLSIGDVVFLDPKRLGGIAPIAALGNDDVKLPIGVITGLGTIELKLNGVADCDSMPTIYDERLRLDDWKVDFAEC